MADRPGRDRSGEPFQDNFTEDRGVRRPKIEQAQHDLDMEGDQIKGYEEPVKHDGEKKDQQP